MILGLDISTSITGATIIDDKGNIVYCKAWDTRKLKNFFDKANFIKRNLAEVRQDFPITKIVIEVPRGTKAKEVVLEYVKKTIPNFEYELTKAGNPKPGTYDRSDSIILALSCFKN